MRSPLHEGPAVGDAAALHGDVVGLFQPALGDAAIQPPAPLGPHAAFDAMAQIGTSRVHLTNL